MSKLIVANWKMNGSINKVKEDLSNYVQDLATNRHNVVFALPYIYLPIAAPLLGSGNLKLASQDVSVEPGYGAYTGEVSSVMLKEFNIEYAIVGHSERRMIFGEDGYLLVRKIENLLANNITPIFCLGEAQEIRDGGRYLDFIVGQLELLLQIKQFKNLVIAYEPIWSIGTGLVPNNAQIVQVLNAIKAFVQSYLVYDKIELLYGGSVSGKNAFNILSEPVIDGVLVGGASLKVDDFSAICRFGQ